MARSSVLRLFPLLALLAVLSACARGPVGGAASPQPGDPPASTPPVQSSSFQAKLIAEACEWSMPTTPPGKCFGKSPSGYTLTAILRYGNRWQIWDPVTKDYAFVDAAVLDLPSGASATVVPTANRTTVICIDQSKSYRYRQAALTSVAALIMATARSGYVYYVRWIDQDSYGQAAEIMPALTIPPVTPVQQAEATPTPTCNAFDLKCRKEEASTSSQHAPSPAVAVQTIAGRLATLPAATSSESSSSDLRGCIEKASELLANASGEKYLLVATFLDRPDQPPPDARLDVVKLRFFDVQCDDHTACDAAKKRWLAMRDQYYLADDVRFLDPEEDLSTTVK